MIYYLNILLRKFKNNPAFPIINITGLTIGLTISLLAFLYIQDEFSYDNHFTDSENTYRLIQNGASGNEFEHDNPIIFMDNIMEDIPEIKNGLRIHKYASVIKINDLNYKEEKLIYTDSNFFSFFNWQLISGNTKDILSGPNMAAISEDKAKEWYGDDDPIGQTFKLFNYKDITITCVYKNIPSQTHFDADVIISLSTNKKEWNNMYTSWGWFSSDFYLKTDPLADLSLICSKLKESWNYHNPEEDCTGDYVKMILQPVKEIHLKSEYLSDGNNNLTILYCFGALAFFILIIACFNFINLSLALYSKQNIETGIKKTLGAGKKVFTRQVFHEISFYVILALIISSVIVDRLLFFVNNFIGKELKFNVLDNISLTLFIISIGLLIILGTGTLPLLQMLRNKTSGSFSNSSYHSTKKIAGFTIHASLKNLLVILQFTFGIMLIISAIVVNKQLKLIRQKDTGFNKEQVMVIRSQKQNEKFFNTFADKLKQYPEISLVTSANNVPTDGIWNWGMPNVVGQSWRNAMNCGYVCVNYKYFDAIGAKFIQGRNFINNQSTESEKIIITESLMKKLNLNDPKGVKLTELWDDVDREIIGVVKDIEFKSIRHERSPVLFFCRNRNFGWYQKFIIKLNSPDLEKSIRDIKHVWMEIAPEWPIDYFFLDEQFNNNYHKEIQVATIVNILTWLAVFLCCLGLFGLALYNINNKIKEVGVRKVNGANIVEILTMINKEFITLIVVAYLIAVPVSLFFIYRWLNNFAYKTHIPWWTLLLSGILALATALLTVSWQSWMAAKQNPVKALRYE